MGNSPLVCYTKLSPYRSNGRTHAIDTVTIHCMAGDLSVEACGALFQKSGASSNYGIGSDGRIALYVEEKNRSWCSSNAANDHRAVTVEVANTSRQEPFPVSDAAYEALIQLLADVCQRNAIPKLLWKADKTLVGQADKQNMTVHRWFANKSCPGEWLYTRMGEIAQAVNRRLSAALPFRVEITAGLLNVRDGPGTQYPVNTQVQRGEVYTIVEQSGAWGKLKSGAGWICLDYAKKQQ